MNERTGISRTVKVFFCDDAHTFGGTQIALIRLIRLLSDTGKMNLTCVLNRNNSQLIDAVRQLDTVKVLEGYGIGKLYFLRNFFDFAARKKVSECFAKYKPDVVIINQAGIEFGLNYQAVAKRMKIPYLGWMHNPVSFNELLNSQSISRKCMSYLRDYIAEKFLFPRYKGFITVSEYAKNVLIARKVPGSKISTIPNSITFNEVYRYDVGIVNAISRWKDKSSIIGIIGRIEFCTKGHDLLVKAALNLKEKGFAYKYIVIGNGNDQSQLEEMIKQYGLSDEFLLAGWIDDVRPLLELFDLVVVPSRHETFGLTALEAICCGTKVIGSSIQALKSILHPSHIFTSDNFVSLAGKIEQALEEPENCDTESHYQQILLKYSKEHWVESFHEILMKQTGRTHDHQNDV